MSALSTNPELRPKSSLDAIIDLYKRDIDRTLLRENLQLTIQERFDKFRRMMELHDELRRAGEKLRNRD